MRRVILLGASNLTRSFPTIVAAVRQTWREPIDLMVAMGHGRSYGQDSWVCGRKISGIFPCALWRDLQNRAKLPTTAFMTDIGNDLLYGVTANTLLDWVNRCLDELDRAGAATIVTQLPAGSIERLGDRRFRFFRKVLFPRSTLTLTEAKQFVREINDELQRLAESRNLSVISASPSWYGFDPIHIKRRFMRDAWSTMFAEWRAANERLNFPRSSLWTTAYLAALAPLEYAQFGFERRTKQPCARFPDGTTVSLY